MAPPESNESVAHQPSPDATHQAASSGQDVASSNSDTTGDRRIEHHEDDTWFSNSGTEEVDNDITSPTGNDSTSKAADSPEAADDDDNDDEESVVVEWKEYQIHDDSDKEDADADDEYNTYATHNLFAPQDDSDNEAYYEVYEYTLQDQTVATYHASRVDATRKSTNDSSSSSSIDLGGMTPKKKSLAIRHHQETANSTGLGIWIGTETLCRFLEDNPDLVAGKRVIELGAGVGLCGLVAHVLGAADVTVTDGDSVVLKNMRHNIAENVVDVDDDASSLLLAANRIDCRQLIWGQKRAKTFQNHFLHRRRQSQEKIQLSCDQEEEENKFQEAAGGGAFDVVLASECVYMVPSLVPFWETVAELVSWHGIFIFVNVCASQAPLELILQTGAKFHFTWEEPTPNVYLFRRTAELRAPAAR